MELATWLICSRRISAHELRIEHRPQSVLAEQFGKLGQPALLVRPEVVVDMPAEVVLAEIQVVFRARADDVIERIDAEAMEKVLRPKVAGALNLEAAVNGMDLDYVLLFSSATTLFGNPGQYN